jgi:hypothetical protein
MATGVPASRSQIPGSPLHPRRCRSQRRSAARDKNRGPAETFPITPLAVASLCPYPRFYFPFFFPDFFLAFFTTPFPHPVTAIFVL